MTEFVTSGVGDRVAFDRYGTGPGVVFVAGAGPFRAGDPVTTETARLVAERGFTTVVFDRLGRGESPAEGALTLEREISAIGAAIEAAGAPSVLVGHSSGCSLALAAASAGLPVAGLMLWEAPIAKPAQATAEWIAEFERRLDAGDDEGAQIQYMADMPPEFLGSARHSPAWPAIIANARTLRADGQSLVWATAQLESGALSTITQPVLAVYGTSTMPFMKHGASLLEAALPHATTAELEGANHSWAPEAMAEALTAFAAQLPSGA